MLHNNVVHCLQLHVDINECAVNGSCDVNADCDNTDGSFMCTCQFGYTGNGTHCEGNLYCFFYSQVYYSWCVILVIPPSIILSSNSSQFNIGRLREFSLTCQSVGDFAGMVVWVKSGRTVSSIGLCLFTCLLILSSTYSFLIFVCRCSRQPNNYY